MSRIIGILKNIIPYPIKAFLKGIKQRIRNRKFTPYIMEKHVEGVRFKFWIGNRDGRDWYERKNTDPDWPEMRFIRDHILQPGDVVLECGGHHGCTAIVMADWVGPAGKVITFEPLPVNCDIIEKNIHLNNLQNVELERKAVGAEKGTIRIDSASNASVSVEPKQGQQVEMINLDEYLHFEPTVLKIDVEGFELEVLKGAEKVLAAGPKLAIEIHPRALKRYGASVKDLIDQLKVDRYQFWIQRDDGLYPERYDLDETINQRVHLFGVLRS